MSEKLDRDQYVLELYEQLLELEQRMIPTGLHIFGQPADAREQIDMLRAVAAFERPEYHTRSLPELIAIGLKLPAYSLLLRQCANSEIQLQQREQIEQLLDQAIREFVARGSEAATQLLQSTANVPIVESSKVFQMLSELRQQLSINHEMESLVKALRGEYIEPGPGADLIQNPKILPTGRNTHAVDPSRIPSLLAVEKGAIMAAAMLKRHYQEQGRYPESVAMVLWGMDNIKTQGESVAQALYLLGVKPRRDSLNRATDIEIIPLSNLARPRIDVVMTVSGIFRDLFGPSMALLDQAVRMVAQLDEPVEMNFIKRHVETQMREENCSFDDAIVRVFSNAAGNYGSNVNFMILDSQWENDETLAELFVTRKCFAYGRKLAGYEARQLMEKALSRVEVTYQNLDTAEMGITDIDHYFEYLGGVSKAVEKRAGKKPAIYLSDNLGPGLKIRTIDETVRLESRTKLLNPKWYEGLLKHGFRGVAEIENHVANTFGWSATADAVDNWIYDEVAGTFLLDEQMLARLRDLNPDSTRNLIGRLLEATGRGFWQADEKVLAQLRELYQDLEDQLEGVK
jgi:magnesium chelatase subunit H